MFGLLPLYFNRYREIIEKEPPRVGLLFQFIKLLNKSRNDPFGTNLESIEQMNLSYCQLSYNISKTHLNTYDPICRIKNCFVCINR